MITLIAMVCMDKMVYTAKDSHKRVYKSDRAYHHPKIEANRLRKAGEMYSKPMELTGSSENTQKTLKISLLYCYTTKTLSSM